MNKFKRGDEVRLVDNTNINAKLGALAVVEGYGSSGEYIEIKWHRDDPRTVKQGDGGYFEHMFKIADREWDENNNEST